RAVTIVLAGMVLAGALTTMARGRPALTIRRLDEAHLAASPGQPFFAVIVGSDARPGQSGGRGDALHLVGVNPALGRATILNIPRDTYVSVPGQGRAKINDAMAAGGPTLQGRVVGDLVGVTVSFVVSTDF